jgi:hypothetical protein
MTDLDWWAATRYPSVHDDWRPSSSGTGRHAINEEAAETPIFHALSTGAWRTREPAAATPPSRPAAASRGTQRRGGDRGAQDRAAQDRRSPDRGVHDRRDRGGRDRAYHDRPVHDPVDAFRRDPLTMPIPVQAAAPTEAARRAAFGAHALRPEQRSQQSRSEQPRPGQLRSERTRQPEPPRRPERGRRQERSWEPEPPAYPERPASPGHQSYREAVSDSGRHHRRRPSISSLL